MHFSTLTLNSVFEASSAPERLLTWSKLSSTPKRISFTKLNFNIMLSTLIRGYYKIKQLYSSFCTCKTTPINHSVSLCRVSCKEFVSEFSTRKTFPFRHFPVLSLSANYIQFLPSFPSYTGFWEA